MPRGNRPQHTTRIDPNARRLNLNRAARRELQRIQLAQQRIAQLFAARVLP
jgi:hypothetical protein